MSDARQKPVAQSTTALSQGSSCTDAGEGQHVRDRSLAHAMGVVLDFIEPAIEWIIRICGWSAIVFVFSIFFFIFCEAAPVFRQP